MRGGGGHNELRGDGWTDGDIDKWWTENRLKHNAVSVEVNLMVPCRLVDSSL